MKKAESVSQTCAVSLSLSGLASLRLGRRGDEEWHSGTNQLLVV